MNRQLLFSDSDKGSSKVKVANEMLQKINPYGKYLANHCSLQELDPITYQLSDLYITGLDSVDARNELNRRAVTHNKPLVDEGTATYHGHIYNYLPRMNACLNCYPMKEKERDELAACKLVGIPRKRNHCFLKGQLYFESSLNDYSMLITKKMSKLCLTTQMTQQENIFLRIACLQLMMQ